MSPERLVDELLNQSKTIRIYFLCSKQTHLGFDFHLRKIHKVIIDSVEQHNQRR